MLDHEWFCERAEKEISTLVAVVAAAPDIAADVPSCPGWTIADLAGHTGSVHRWAAAIGPQRTVRWSVLGSDRDQPGRHVAVVQFPSYAEAMANSGHPATHAFLKELQSISSSQPQFRNLDVRSVQTY